MLFAHTVFCQTAVVDLTIDTDTVGPQRPPVAIPYIVPWTVMVTGYPNRVSTGADTVIDHLARLEDTIYRAQTRKCIRPPFSRARPVFCEALDPELGLIDTLQYLEDRVLYEARFPDRPRRYVYCHPLVCRMWY